MSTILDEVVARMDRLAASGEPDMETNWRCGLCHRDRERGVRGFYRREEITPARGNRRAVIRHEMDLICPCCSFVSQSGCEHHPVPLGESGG